MSTIDQAFIRAYRDDAVPAPPAVKPVNAADAIRTAIIDIGPYPVPSPHADFAGASRQLPAKAPLSTFAPAPEPGTAPLRPALEVDAVRWPPLCETLLKQHSALFDSLAQEVLREAAAGCRIIAVTGAARGQGRTTLGLCLVRRLAAAGAKAVLVDGDFASPGIAKQLSIYVQHGWEAVLATDKTLDEVLIESVDDRFALLPLGARAAEMPALSVYRIAATLHDLAEEYELVLIDAGPLMPDSERHHWLLERAAGAQGTIVVHDARHGSASLLAAACLQLADAGQRQLGIAETFVPVVQASA